jgi:hypothetical protein
MKKSVFSVLCGIMFLSGCYTQIAMVRREPPPPQVTYEVDSLGDTVKVVHSADTVVKERENCYWTRNMWGQPEWRCGGSYYSSSWNLYNDYPWWYSSYPYYYDSYGRCPQYYYYDASCSSCRRYEDRDYYYSNQNRSGGNISPSGSKSPARRSPSSTVPGQSAVKGPAAQNPTNSSKQGFLKLETPSTNTQTPVANPGPTSSASAPPPATGSNQSNPPAVSSPPPTIQSNPPASSSPPPSNNNGGSGNNDRKHRNPRSW